MHRWALIASILAILSCSGGSKHCDGSPSCEAGDGGTMGDGGPDGGVGCTPETEATTCTTPTQPICKVSTHTCEKCGTAADCASLPGKVCVASGACVACAVQGDCSGGQICDTTTNTCKACTGNAQCDGGDGIRDAGACVAKAMILFVDAKLPGAGSTDGYT